MDPVSPPPASTPVFLTCGHYQVVFLADFALVIWSLNPHISSLLIIIQMCSRAQALTGLVYLMTSLGDVDQLHQLRSIFATYLDFYSLNFCPFILPPLNFFQFFQVKCHCYFTSLKCATMFLVTVLKQVLTSLVFFFPRYCFSAPVFLPFPIPTLVLSKHD